MLQGFPTHFDDGEVFQLVGKSDKMWREWIGNAVPPAAAQGMAETVLRSMLASHAEDLILGNTAIWVQPIPVEELFVFN